MKHMSFTFTALLGISVRCTAVVVTFVPTLGLSLASLLRTFVQTLLCFRILDAVLHALRIGYSFSMFETGLRGLVTSTVPLRGSCI